MQRRSITSLVLAVCLAFAWLTPLFAQDKNAPAAAAAAAAPTEETTAGVVHEKTLWEDLKEGGLSMVVIGICSVATFYLIIDGVLRITSFKKTVPEQHVMALKNLFRKGDYVNAAKFCKNNPSPFTSVVGAGLVMAGEGRNATEEAVLAEVSTQNSKMQYFISYLSVIGVCTPMVGLLGTVFGMKHAFKVLNTSGVGDPSKLSGAIGEVLICTAMGLLIAIPAFFAFYWLRNRSARVIHNIQENVNALFRKMPYEQLAGAHLGDDELFAAIPNWVQGGDYPAEQTPA